jgi:hypothetical protein
MTCFFGILLNLKRSAEPVKAEKAVTRRGGMSDE